MDTDNVLPFPLDAIEPIPMFKLFEITTEHGPMNVNPNSVVTVTTDLSRAGAALLILAAGGQTIPIPARETRPEVVSRIHRALSTGMPVGVVGAV